MIKFAFLHPRATEDHLGAIPFFLSEADPRPTKEQFDTAYAHGGGWSPMEGWRRDADNTLKYPGDPPMQPLAVGQLRDEKIFVYLHAWVSILQPDGSFEVSRMD